MADATNPLPRKKPNILWWLGGVFLLLVILFFFQLFGPSPKIAVTRQTTYITTPLRRDGLPDYERHLLELAREGVTPENNAAVLLVQALWPAELSPQDYPVVLQELGLTQVPSSDNVLKPMDSEASRARLTEWVKKLASETTSSRVTNQASDQTADEAANNRNAADSADVVGPVAQPDPVEAGVDLLLDQVTTRPWTSAQIPPLGKWIEENQRSINLILAATKLPKCYFPSPSLLDNRHESLIAVLLPLIQSSRGAARALATRCMWHVGEGRLDAAWQDALATHRLARLLAQDQTLVGQLVAIAIDGVACQADLCILDHAQLSPALARQILNDLAVLPPIANTAKTIDQGERLMGIDAVLFARTSGFAPLTGMSSGSQGDNLIASSPRWLAIDWNLVLVKMNQWYDRFAEAGRIESREDRIQAFTQIETDIRAASEKVNAPAHLLGGLVNRGVRSELVANVIASLLLPALNAFTAAEDRGNTQLALTRVAAALAVFRTEQGSYPKKLDDLVPNLLPQSPIDVYSGKPYVYKPDADGRGYLLYSVFQNGKDDGGTSYDGDIVRGQWVDPSPGIDHDQTDMVIRLPMPKFKIPQPPAAANAN